MLAKIDWSQAPQPIPEIVEYSGFPSWHALLTEPGREVRSAELLKRVNIHVYLPLFTKQSRRARGICCHRQCPVLPCMMFIPTEFLDHDRRDAILAWAGVRLHRTLRPITKAEVELIRDVEARINRKLTKKMASFAIGGRVRFHDERWAYSFGEAEVFEIASENRIGVIVPSLFGRATKVFVPATEIEAI